MARTPTEEKSIYDTATDMVETPETVLPLSGIGMQARKRALREGRVTPAWKAAADAEAAAKGDEVAEAAAVAAAEAVEVADAEVIEAKAAAEAEVAAAIEAAGASTPGEIQPTDEGDNLA